MTSTRPSVVSHPLWAFRGALLGASLVGLSFAMVAVIGYPAPPGQIALYWTAIVLLSGYAVLAWFGTRMRILQLSAIRTLSLWFGLLSGGCWIIEMVTANLVPLPAGTGLLVYLVVYRGATLLGLALPLVAGFVATRATGRLGAGIAVSFWSGFISGLIAYLTLMFLTYTFLGTFEHDPQTLSQFAQSHRQQPTLGLSAFIVGDSLLGSLSHLLLIGLGWGTVLGTVGALLGRVLRRSKATGASYPFL